MVIIANCSMLLTQRGGTIHLGTLRTAGASEALEERVLGQHGPRARGLCQVWVVGVERGESPGPGTPCFDLRSQQPCPHRHCHPTVAAIGRGFVVLAVWGLEGFGPEALAEGRGLGLG